MEDDTERAALSPVQVEGECLKTALWSALRDLSRNRILGPAAGAFLLRVSGAGLQFLFTLLLARFYGAAGVGVYVIGLSILVVASTIARWGLDQTSMKLVAAGVAGKNYRAAREIVVYARNIILLTAIAGTLLLLLLSDVLASIFFTEGEASVVFAIMGAALLPLSLATLFAEALRGLQRVSAYSLIHGLLIPLFSIIFLLFTKGLFEGVIAGAAAYLMACILVALVAIPLWSRAASRLPRDESEPPLDRAEALATSRHLAWVTIISVAMTFTETFVLGLFHEEVSVGLYAAALRLALLINFFIIAFNSILAPNFSALFRQGKLTEIETLARQSILLMLVPTLPVVVLFCLLPGPVLSIFGDEFAQAASALILLSLGQLVNIISGPVGILLQMTGEERAYRNNVIISAASTLSASLILIPPFAVVGAAGSAVFGILLLNTLSLLTVRKRLGINPLPLNPIKILRRSGK
jgi:O-antigen/teichoic acid export membrane protein